MNVESKRRLAQKLVERHGTQVAWTRRFLNPGGASGVVTEAAPPETFEVFAVPLGPDSFDTIAQQWWQTAAVRLCIPARGLPFDPDPVSGEPGVELTDTVVWGGREFRVLGVEPFRLGSPGVPERPYLYFVALGS